VKKELYGENGIDKKGESVYKWNTLRKSRRGWKFLEFPEFLGNTAVHARNLLEKGHVGPGRCPGSLERTLKNFG